MDYRRVIYFTAGRRRQYYELGELMNHSILATCFHFFPVRT